MNVKSRKKYDQNFKDQVVALVELGKPIAEVADEMEVSRDLVYAWKAKASRLPKLGSGDAGVPQARDEQVGADELRALRRRVADLQLENANVAWFADVGFNTLSPAICMVSKSVFGDTQCHP